MSKFQLGSPKKKKERERERQTDRGGEDSKSEKKKSYKSYHRDTKNSETTMDN